MAGELAAQPAAPRALARRARAQELRGRGAAALHRDHARAGRHRRRVDRCGRPHRHRRTPPRCGCSSSMPASWGSRRSTCSAAPDLHPLGALLHRRLRAESRRHGPGDGAGARGATATWPRSRRAAGATAAASEGIVLVLDDVTPLIRAQKVAAWREVARRLAHEIKNPLTPIQLSAERMRRQLRDAPAPTSALVDECTRRSSAKSSR